MADLFSFVLGLCLVGVLVRCLTPAAKAHKSMIPVALDVLVPVLIGRQIDCAWGCHRLPIEQGRHLRLPRVRHVCRLCGNERHLMLSLSDIIAESQR